MLIRCPECNKEISSEANCCPNCGYPIKNTIKDSTIISNMYQIIITGYKTSDVEIVTGLENVLDLIVPYKIINDLLQQKYCIFVSDKESEAINIVNRLNIYGVVSEILQPGEKKLPLYNKKKTDVKQEELKISNGIKVVTFLIPIIGVILFCLNLNRSPIASKTYLRCAIWGIIIEFFLALYLI